MSPAIRQHLEEERAPGLAVAPGLVTPQILRIDRYSLKPGTEASVRNLQKQVALAMARWRGPHPCLAIESLTGPKEVWRLSGFQSPAEQRKAAESLGRNEGLRIRLQRIEDQTRVLTGNPATILATCSADPRRGPAWLMGRGRFLVISVFDWHSQGEGAVYETESGIRYRITATRTRQSADARKAAAGSSANVFAVRPTWGMPAWEWTRNDRVFWTASPVARRAATPPHVAFTLALESVEVES